jgi:hypothetical protein
MAVIGAARVRLLGCLKSTERLHGFILLIFLAFLNAEHDVGVKLFVERQFSSLTEGSGATREIALEGFLTSVDIGVFFEVLRKGEALEADDTDVLLDL